MEISINGQRTVNVTLKEDTEIKKHFAAVYEWIAEQSPECEVMFARYVIDLLGSTLLSDKNCMRVLGQAAKKAGIYAK